MSRGPRFGSLGWGWTRWWTSGRGSGQGLPRSPARPGGWGWSRRGRPAVARQARTPRRCHPALPSACPARRPSRTTLRTEPRAGRGLVAPDDRLVAGARGSRVTPQRYIEGMTEIEGMIERITPRQFHQADGVEDWRVVGEGACMYF